MIAEHEGETKVMCASVQKSPFLRAITLGLSDVAVFFVGAALAALAYVVKRAGGECGETVVVLVEVFFSYVFAALAWLTHALDFVTCGLLSALHLLLCELSTGLVPGHAYTVLAVRAVPILCLPAMDSQRLAASCLTSKFVKLRNPWGAMAWKGAYGRGSLLWRLRPGLAQVRRARAAPSKRAMRSHARARAHSVLAASAAMTSGHQHLRRSAWPRSQRACRFRGTGKQSPADVAPRHAKRLRCADESRAAASDRRSTMTRTRPGRGESSGELAPTLREPDPHAAHAPTA